MSPSAAPPMLASTYSDRPGEGAGRPGEGPGQPGEGELSIRLARRGLRVRGTDISPEVIDEARRRASNAKVDVDFRPAPVEALDPSADAAELIICCEVMEHLTDPHRALDVIADLA